MKINGRDLNNTFTSYKHIVVSYHKSFWWFGKKKPGVIDSYDLFVDFNENIGRITKGDATDYGMSSYAMFQDDFDEVYEYSLTDMNDYELFKKSIEEIFGANSPEIIKIKAHYENKNKLNN